MRLELCQAVGLILGGQSFHEIADGFGCSGQTVRNRWKDFERKVEEEGLMAAAEECNVVEEVNSLRKLSNSIVKEKICLDECVTGHNVAVTLKKLGLSLKDVGLFLKDLYQYAEDQNITGSEMGKLAYKLHEASSVSGMEYPELADEVNRLNGEKDKAESELLEIERQLKKAYKDLEKRLDEAKVTEKKLDTYLGDKSTLESEGLYIDDIARTSRVIKEFREKEFDSNKIIEQVQKHGSLTTEIKRLESEVKKLVENKEEIENDITTLFEKKKECEEEIIGLKNESEKLHEPLKAFRELNSKNLYKEDILNLRDLVVGADYTVEELKSSLTEMGGLEKLRDEKHRQQQSIEARITTLNKRAEGLEQDIKDLMDRKNTISEDTEETISEFKAEMLSITSLFHQITNDPEKGLKANFIGLVEGSLEEADIRLKKFEVRAKQRMKSVEDDAAAANERVAELGEKIRAYKIDFSNYRTLENLARLFLGMEVKRGEKLLLITSTLETLEDTLNYLGLNSDANNLRRVKENVYRSAGASQRL